MKLNLNTTLELIADKINKQIDNLSETLNVFSTLTEAYYTRENHILTPAEMSFLEEKLFVPELSIGTGTGSNGASFIRARTETVRHMKYLRTDNDDTLIAALNTNTGEVIVGEDPLEAQDGTVTTLADAISNLDSGVNCLNILNALNDTAFQGKASLADFQTRASVYLQNTDEKAHSLYSEIISTLSSAGVTVPSTLGLLSNVFNTSGEVTEDGYQLNDNDYTVSSFMLEGLMYTLSNVAQVMFTAIGMIFGPIGAAIGFVLGGITNSIHQIITTSVEYYHTEEKAGNSLCAVPLFQKEGIDHSTFSSLISNVDFITEDTWSRVLSEGVLIAYCPGMVIVFGRQTSTTIAIEAYLNCWCDGVSHNQTWWFSNTKSNFNDRGDGYTRFSPSDSLVSGYSYLDVVEPTTISDERAWNRILAAGAAVLAYRGLGILTYSNDSTPATLYGKALASIECMHMPSAWDQWPSISFSLSLTDQVNIIRQIFGFYNQSDSSYDWDSFVTALHNLGNVMSRNNDQVVITTTHGFQNNCFYITPNKYEPSAVIFGLIAGAVVVAVTVAAVIVARAKFRKWKTKQQLKQLTNLDTLRGRLLETGSQQDFDAYYAAMRKYNRMGKFFHWGTYDIANAWINSDDDSVSSTLFGNLSDSVSELTSLRRLIKAD